MNFAPGREVLPPLGVRVHTLGGMTAETGSEDAHSSDELKSSLRRVFDSQMPNYGDYNLVCATPLTDSSGYFVLGYRWSPPELVFAPFAADTLEGLEAPTAVNTTNLSYTDEVSPGSYEVVTSTGRIFRFGVEAEAKLPAAPDGGHRLLRQHGDRTDFHSFLDVFLELA